MQVQLSCRVKATKCGRDGAVQPGKGITCSCHGLLKWFLTGLPKPRAAVKQASISIGLVSEHLQSDS